jgi:hypothetical protein
VLTEGLVRQGVTVTLFATQDSLTQAELRGLCPSGYEESRNIDPKVWECLHIAEVFEHAQEFDVIHNHFDFLPLTYSALVNTPVLTTIHGFSSPKILPDTGGIVALEERRQNTGQDIVAPPRERGSDSSNLSEKRLARVLLLLPALAKRGQQNP